MAESRFDTINNKRYAFAKAHWLPLILKKYKEEERRDLPRYDFKNIDRPWVSDALERLCGGDFSTRTQDEDTVFTAFAELADPSYDRKNGKNFKFLHWICKSWLTSPVRAEDLYKIREDLAYFESLSNRLHKDGKPNQIEKLDSFMALAGLLEPYEFEKKQKDAERAERRMSSEDKVKLARESTALFDGEAGKIVMPHTVWAAQFWGNQTKWCISAEDMQHNMFDYYNERHPVIIYLPKPSAEDMQEFSKYHSFKFAAVGPELYDEQDKWGLPRLPAALKKLVGAVPDALHGYLDTFGQAAFIKNRPVECNPVRYKRQKCAITLPENHPHYGLLCSFYRAPVFKADSMPPQETWQDRELLHAAIRAAPRIFEYLPDYCRADRETALLALSFTASAMQAMPEDFKNDREMAEFSVMHHDDAYRYVGEDLRNDLDFAMFYIERYPGAYMNLPEKWQAHEDVMARVLQNLSSEPVRPLHESLRNSRSFAQKIIAHNPYDIRHLSERLVADTEIALDAADRGGGANIDYLLQKRLKALKARPDIFHDAIAGMEGRKKITRRLRHMMEDAGQNAERALAVEILEKGYGLSPQLVPETCLENQGYVLSALKIAQSHGVNRPLHHLRHIPFLRGNAGRITDVKRAIEHLALNEGQKKTPPAKIAQRRQNAL